MTPGFAAFDRPRKLDRAPEQQHLFGHGGLPGVRVRNDGERAAAGGFLQAVSHGLSGLTGWKGADYSGK